MNNNTFLFFIRLAIGKNLEINTLKSVNFVDTLINLLRIPSTLTTTETYGMDSVKVEYYDA